MKSILNGILVAGALLTLASCGNETNFYPYNPDISAINPEKNNDYPDLENGTIADYTSPNIEYNTNINPSPETPVEKTVAMVYNSVVSVTAYSQTGISCGSGVLFSYDESLNLSYIATCYHVIENCAQFEIVLTNNEKLDASVVGVNLEKDIAILSIEKTGLTYSDFFQDSNNLHLGSQVVCIGNALGTLHGSVSTGIISYVNRQIQVNSYTTMNLIQTDVAINSGNSGGGLYNTSGALIGIINAKYSDSGIEGLGFAIPSNDVRDTVEEILSTAMYDKNNKIWSCGYIEGEWDLGATLSDGYYGNYFGGEKVIYVSSVSNNSYSSCGGALNCQDIIKGVKVIFKDNSIEDKTLSFTSASELYEGIYESGIKIGDSLEFEIQRSSHTMTIKFEIRQYKYQTN